MDAGPRRHDSGAGAERQIYSSGCEAFGRIGAHRRGRLGGIGLRLGRPDSLKQRQLRQSALAAAAAAAGIIAIDVGSGANHRLFLTPFGPPIKGSFVSMRETATDDGTVRNIV
jgi:hypothetical protein